jgi:hypothetical protein
LRGGGIQCFCWNLCFCRFISCIFSNRQKLSFGAFFNIAFRLIKHILTHSGPKFAPYYDTFLRDRTVLTDMVAATGQKDFHLAFALGSGFEGCKPMWGAEFALDDPEILGPIKTIQAMGGEMIVAAGMIS